jgi:microcystin-dependent protein
MSIVLDGTTGVTAPALTGPINAANLTGVLPAIDGSALTGINGTPIGAVVHFAASAAPTGFIKANGASLSTTTYATLFAVIGYTFGGSGASFNLPDLRGEFLRGWDDARGVDSGRVFGSAQADAFRSHNHYIGTYGYDGGGSVKYNDVSFSNWQNVGTISTAATGGTETRPRNVALLACIKY